MELEIIKHRDILFRDILRVIEIKSVAWPYPVESQLKWLIDNLDEDDEHVFLKDGAQDLAYLNLVKIQFTADGTEYAAYGLGNVCAVEKGKGYGRELMERVNKYIKSVGACGLLFCKTPLIPFYARFDWKEVKREACCAPSLADGVHVMTYLAPEEVQFFQYTGKLF